MKERNFKLVAATIACVLVGGKPGAAEREVLTLVVHVSNLAGTEDATLTRAQAQADRIFRDVGVRVVWRGDSPSRSDPGCDGALLLALLHTETVWQLSSPGLKKESVLGSASKAVRRAFVYPARISDLAGRTRGDFSQLLGRVIVHEIGHLLLPAGHSQSGIMSARMETDPAKKSALFMVSEGIAIRALVSSKTCSFKEPANCAD